MAVTISRRLASKLLHRHHPPPPSAAFFSTSHHSPHRLNPNPFHYPPLQQNPSFPTLHPHNLTRSFIHQKPVSLNQILTTNLNIQNPKVNFIETPKLFSTASTPPPPDPEHTRDPNDPQTQTHEFKHQEIEGPTVERDVSSLTNETRQVFDKVLKSIYSLSNGLAVFGLVQLGIGAWILYINRASPIPEVSIQSFLASGLSFSLSFMLRASLKLMNFFRQREEQGKLQTAKDLNVFFVRVRGLSYALVASASIGLAYVAFTR